MTLAAGGRRMRVARLGLGRGRGSAFGEQVHELAEIERLVERADETTLQTIGFGEFEEILKVLDYVGMFGVILNQPGILEKLVKCFKKVK